MDASVNTEIKGVGVTVTPAAVEREDKVKPQVSPVAKGSESSRSGLGEKELHAKSQPKPADAKEVAKAVEEMQRRLDSLGNTRLNFKVQEKPNEVVVQITDRQSGKLIKQFPSEDAMMLRAKLQELSGLLFDEQA
ncbi:MAG: flagellar protein FlaG [Desulfobulbaceae bacterium]|nr:flagellar protein FlaG [Desulfobulbaceae bacterium]HIJ90237.1 flagellar protein FlaG [Deltaproteobacteria bacterium]